MKKVICFIIAAVLAFSVVSFCSYAAKTSGGFDYGDVNNDGFVNVKDVLTLRKYLAGWNDFTDTEAADVNYDTRVNAKDVLLIRKFVANIGVVLGPTQQGTGEGTATSPTAQPTTTTAPEDITATITLKETTASYIGSGVSVDGSKITITSAGLFYVSGKLTDGQLIVAATKEDRVQIMLNGVDIYCSNGSPLFVDAADKCILTTVANTVNTFKDNAADVSTDTNSCIYSDDDLTINGEGTINVYGNKNNAVRTENDLKINGGTINITAAKNGLRGDDSVEIKSGTIKIDCDKDAIKTTNSTEPEKGYVLISGGEITIHAGDDAVQAVNAITVSGCKIYYTAVGKKTKMDSPDGIEQVEDGCFIKLDAAA